MSRTLVSAVAALLFAVGCGKKVKRAAYVDPDAVGRVEGTGLEARDIRAVSSTMAREMLGSAALAGFDGVPRLAVMPVKNRTRFLIDQEIFTTLITDLLIQNAAGKVAVLDRSIVEEIMAERQMKRDGDVDNAGFKAMAGADYFLQGELRSLSATDSKTQSDYVVVRFSLVDAETGIVGWSNSFEMKKEGSWGVMYQ